MSVVGFVRRKLRNLKSRLWKALSIGGSRRVSGGIRSEKVEKSQISTLEGTLDPVARIRWGKDVGMAVSIPAEQDGRTIVRGDIRV